MPDVLPAVHANALEDTQNQWLEYRIKTLWALAHRQKMPKTGGPAC